MRVTADKALHHQWFSQGDGPAVVHEATEKVAVERRQRAGGGAHAVAPSTIATAGGAETADDVVDAASAKRPASPESIREPAGQRPKKG